MIILNKIFPEYEYYSKSCRLRHTLWFALGSYTLRDGSLCIKVIVMFICLVIIPWDYVGDSSFVFFFFQPVYISFMLCL